jgi:hypothetical protein
MQIEGRLIRISQDQEINWRLIHLQYSYHDHQEKAMLSKMARQMAAEAALLTWDFFVGRTQ